ncbi:Spore wall assembly protein [Schizosaccharomyces pombe]|uniref:Forespore membrane adapter protein MUG56 n=1 Tax=Schizosaccharomyces pombe (strain 972 / ATCC 24843) TaxID=284812 RepID=SPO71_SCHPO|nr:putative spore wall assembly protein [Schizosaccharomyces pombe]O13992.1 RecName: Full=Forespore membrane adapter protein MUG56; AltName: Full=Meiotically up-regulated gene 56 protein [Schizosaccharomyces pombe 972h-]CAB16196.1 spore wall assembly protein (predicted) [Schizosaccharomyces pombe]|eukprot:NP_594458.1 putative spore wall assembly protein [Schizosaccharomyces pombe]
MNEEDTDFAWLHNNSAEHLRFLSHRIFIGPIPSNFIHSTSGFFNKRFQNYTKRQICYNVASPNEPPIDFSFLMHKSTDENPDTPSNLDSPSTQNVGSTNNTRASQSLLRRSSSFFRRRHRKNGTHASTDNNPFSESSTLQPQTAERTSQQAVRSAITETTNPSVSVQNSNSTSTSSAAMIIPHRDSQNSLEIAPLISPESQLSSLHPSSSRRHLISTPHVNRGTQFKRSSSCRNSRQPLLSGVDKHLTSNFTDANLIIKQSVVLARIESTFTVLPSDYNDSAAQRVPRKTISPWSQCLLVARQTDVENSIRLDFISKKLRKRLNGDVVHNLDVPHDKSYKSNYLFSVVLSPHQASWNIYNSFDNSMVLWCPYGKNKTLICLLNFQSSLLSFEWISIISRALLFSPRPSLLISVPAFHIHLRLNFPCFKDTTRPHTNETFVTTDDITQLSRTSTLSLSTASPRLVHDLVMKSWDISEDQFVESCLGVLEVNPEWSGIVKTWSKSHTLGLCWRMYDRLEWINSFSSLKYVGLLAAKDLYQLELRPKLHYPNHVTFRDGSKMDEPTPVEGYLIRLTSSTGRKTRYGRMFHKELYFAIFNNFLFAIQPDSVLPLSMLSKSLNLDDKLPFLSNNENDKYVYEFDPFKIANCRASGLNETIDSSVRESFLLLLQAERKRELDMLTIADSFLDLSRVESVCPVEDVEERNIFEITMTNGMKLVFQSYCERTRNLWINKITEVASYWKQRLFLDLQEYHDVRETNINILHIEQSIEPDVACYLNHWEVAGCVASTLIYHYCSMLGCRVIRMQGTLFKKKDALFEKCFAILIPGQLVFFQDATRTKFGKLCTKTHYRKRYSISLKNAFIYTGLSTMDEFARGPNDPQPHISRLPRCYEDGWQSFDRDDMLSFVIWSSGGVDYDLRPHHSVPDTAYGMAKDKLSKPKRFMFLARTRQERDVWAKRISKEINRGHS